jgi:hypothetical protein
MRDRDATRLKRAPWLDRPRRVRYVDHVVTVVGAAEGAYAVRWLQLVALGTTAELRHRRMEMATTVVASTTRDLFLGESAHGVIILRSKRVS